MANWSTGKPKIGDTRGWNERDQTGYKWDGKKWVQYYKGQPLGPFKGHGGITGNVDVVGGVKSGILGSANRIGRAISGAPSDEDYQFVEEQGGSINKPTPVGGGYGDNLEFTMGFNPDSEPIIKGLTDGFTGNLGPLDGYYDETDTTNLLNLYAIGNNDLVSRETGNKGGFWDKLSNSFSPPDPNLEPTVPKEETSSNTMKTWKDPYYGDGRDDVIGGRNWDNPVGAEGGGKPSEGDFRMDFPDGTKRLRSAQDYAKAVEDGSWGDMTNWERTQAKVFAKGSPMKRMKIKQAQSTFNNDDLFTKNRKK